MSTRWTNKHTILQDLAYAQGSVPLDIDNPLTSNQKPPREICDEDIEDKFYDDCMANGDFSNGPDISMIKELLNVVRNADVNPDIETAGQEINKLNINNLESVPGTSADHNFAMETNLTPNEIVPKKRRNRNAAIMSLIESYGDNLPNTNENNHESKSLKLLKPNDFIHMKEPSSQDKVTSWLNSMENRLSPANMFKKKTIAETSSMFKKNVQSAPETEMKCENASEVYVPSAKATEYYEKYVEKSKMKEVLEGQMHSGNIWTRAEEKMKEIEEKKKNEKETVTSPTTSESLPPPEEGSSSKEIIFVQEPNL